MGRTGISKSQVFGIIEKLEKRGVVPTIQLIRKELGSGSLTTISKYFQDWKEAKIDALESSSQPELFTEIKSVPEKVLANFLVNEHPQMIAVLLGGLPESKAAKVLALLPEKIQLDVLDRISDMDFISPEVLNLLDDVVSKELASLFKMETNHFGGVKKASNIISFVNSSSKVKILEDLEKENPKLARIIKSSGGLTNG